MSNALTDSLTRERSKLTSTAETIMERCADEGTDLSEADQNTITKARSRVAEIDSQLALIADDWEMSDDVSGKLARLAPASGAAPAQYRSSGELLWDVLHQSDEDARRRFTGAKRRAAAGEVISPGTHHRAAEHMGTDKANTVATAGDLGGLTISPVTGPVVDPYPAGMPLAAAIGLIPAPNSLTFMRPRIVDPNFTTGVGEQAGGKEKAELPSKAFEVDADPVSLGTVGGYLNISQQLISLQPGSLSLIINHMRRRLEYAIDVKVAGAVTGTGAAPIAKPTDAKTFLAAVYKAARQYYDATKSLPTWIAFGPAGWEFMGGLVDGADRPMFPYLGASNAPGAMTADSFAMMGPAGLRPVVTPAITDAAFYVGGADGVEGYLYRFPILEAVEPSVLGRQVAVAAAVGTHTPVKDSIQKISG